MKRNVKDLSSPHALLIFFLLHSSINTPATGSDGFDVDPEGYMMFCPCMGRFGNQIAQFLGAMSFAKALNRTLILPHFIEYIPYQSGSLQIPFEDYFRYSSVLGYHKALTMDFFMGTVGNKVFPKGKRYILVALALCTCCYFLECLLQPHQ